MPILAASALVSFLPIAGLLVIVTLLILSLPRIQLGHSSHFLRRRFMNWFPLGMTYAFMYMGRYNLTVAKVEMGGLIDKGEFGLIFGVGAIVYGVSFLINGPLADRIGGRATILIGAGGSAVMNLAMGLVLTHVSSDTVVPAFVGLYALNMYFQSFGAVSIVKVNAAWFHVRERGVFGGIFGILISLGIYFAFDWTKIIIETRHSVPMAFYVPAAILAAFVVLDAFVVRDSPSRAGLSDFDTGDASSGDDGPRLPVFQVARKMFRNPVIVTIALIEFCSGFLRQAIMQWYRIFSKATGETADFVSENWGVILCAAGITGGVFAGTISDRVFHSRRGPSAGILYAFMVAGSVATFFLLGSPALGWVMAFMSLSIIGVHGMLSGTASMDFGGRRNVGVAVGLIDGMVYLGTGLQALVLGNILPRGEGMGAQGARELGRAAVVAREPAADPASWWAWPLAMLPVALIGLLLTLRIWTAKPRPGGESAAS